MTSKAYVNGVECTIYDYTNINGVMICRVRYSNYNILLPVLAELIEVKYEQI